ncbi:MAG: putative dsRNA-binding protein, partial [Myxococcota bacterium]|nr:putative dsRNA-binding protein [Myxococcota bacterium]
LVDKRAHAALARDLGLADVIELGRTVRGSDADTIGLHSILANAMEAVIGAMYLDGGEPAVGALVENCFPAAFEAGATRPLRDPKTELQEACVARFGALPRYTLISDNGVDGDELRFRVEVALPDTDATTGHGVGRSKRVAERLAAGVALEALSAVDLRDEKNSA